MWDQSGGYFVPLELQARWIAYTWGGGAIPAPTEENQRRAVELYRSRRGLPPEEPNERGGAWLCPGGRGVEPCLEDWPGLRRALLFGPLAPSSFRLHGPDSLSDAATRFARDAAAFGAITSNDDTERERAYWSVVQAATVT